MVRDPSCLSRLNASHTHARGNAPPYAQRHTTTRDTDLAESPCTCSTRCSPILMPSPSASPAPSPRAGTCTYALVPWLRAGWTYPVTFCAEHDILPASTRLVCLFSCLHKKEANVTFELFRARTHMTHPHPPKYTHAHTRKYSRTCSYSCDVVKCDSSPHTFRHEGQGKHISTDKNYCLSAENDQAGSMCCSLVSQRQGGH